MAATKAAKIWRRTLVGGSIAAVLVLLLTLTAKLESPWPVFLCGLVLAAMCSVEFVRMEPRGRARLARPVVLTFIPVLLLWWNWLAPGGYPAGHHAAFALPEEALRFVGPPSLLLQVAAVALCAFVARGAWLRGVAAGVWIVIPLLGLTHVWSEFGTSGLVALIVLSKVGDIAGYYVGSAIGKRHPFPGISPGKTVAGCVASLVVGGLVGLALVEGGILPDGRLGLIGGGLAGLWINIWAQAGDLLESAVKRRAAVKDSGTLFGPSGGFLDLCDSLLLSVPAALCAWPWLF